MVFTSVILLLQISILRMQLIYANNRLILRNVPILKKVTSVNCYNQKIQPQKRKKLDKIEGKL